jgi:hypothetical protein
VRRKDLCGSVMAVYVLEKLPDVSRPGLVVVESYRMVSKPTLTVSQTRVSQLCKHGAHGWSRPRVAIQHGTCAGTGHTDVAKRGHSWLGIDRRGRRSLKGVRSNIPAQGLTGLIGYSYQQVATSFSEIHLQKTLRLSMFGLEQFQDG